MVKNVPKTGTEDELFFIHVRIKFWMKASWE